MIKHKMFTVNFTNEEAKTLGDALDVLVDISHDDSMPKAIIDLVEKAAGCIDRLFDLVEDCAEFEDESD